jgi:shikimate 5-dehydrogenase
LSCHERLTGESLSNFLLRLERSASEKQHLKAAPVIETLSEAQELLRWQNENPSGRSILPRSKAGDPGRWMWLRLYQKGRQKINFWRESDGSAVDQPTLFEWLSTPDRPAGFAALIGNPVHHSRTMVEQSAFFADRNGPVWPIRLEESEFHEALPFLISLGLQAAAVTSPFKSQAFEVCHGLSPEAERLKAVNTLAIESDRISGHNTDLQGLRAQIEKACQLIGVPLQQASAAIWGGGGTLAALQEILPQAVSLSVRTRQPRSPDQCLPDKVQVLVWAAGPEDDPPPQFDFEILVDLNYREDSRAREWALQHGRRYLSGLDLFLAQAQGQRDYWTRLAG